MNDNKWIKLAIKNFSDYLKFLIFGKNISICVSITKITIYIRLAHLRDINKKN